jgi:(p)ppGpp synthase/HD superfamily hydrolase
MKTATPSLLARAIEIAASAHATQVDKGGAPYILHPLRMMMKQSTEAAMIAAVLHDVVEDWGELWPLERLRAEGFPPDVTEAVVCLTKIRGEDYVDFIQRAGANPIARAVKLADLEDNMDVRRIPELGEEDFKRLLKYRRSWETLKRMEAGGAI